METINTFIHSLVPSKTIPDSRPKWHKILPDGVAHTYMAYIREYPPSGPLQSLGVQLYLIYLLLPYL